MDYEQQIEQNDAQRATAHDILNDYESLGFLDDDLEEGTE